MPLFRNETESTDTRLVQRIVGIYERCPDKQGVMRLGLVARMDYSEERPDELLDWSLADASCGYQSLSDRSSKNSTRSSGSVYQQPRHSYSAASDLPRPATVKTQPKESDSERRARLLQEVKKIKVKSDKKRLKKQKQKERKRLEKEKQNPVKNEEGKENAQQSKAVNDTSKNYRDSSVKQLASAQDPDSSDSSEEESSDEDSDTEHDSDDSEELDMTSTFVSKAALIARRKLEQKPERFEKKKIQVKEEVKKSSPDKPIEEPQVEKKDPAAPRSPTFEDNLKISSDLANIGNRCASAGDFNVAVKYFTDAIKYNPTEFKLFGNRSFCFEKIQEYSKALTDAELSLSMCPGWVKGLFRKGRALAGLKRYEEAAQAFTEVLKGDSACAEAAQELMRVQITQLMAYGYTRKQSSNALIIHGTVKEALQVLSQLSQQPGAIETGAQVANITGVSPVLSANSIPAPPKSQDAPKAPIMNKPLGPVHNMSNYQNQPKPIPYQAMNTNSQTHYRPDQELFPIWVGNLMYPVPESLITNMFSKAGTIYSVKVLAYKRCAFVNYTKQEYCDEAIRLFHGYELNGIKIAVRYPDRIPHGMGISRSAIKADDLQDENMRLNEYVDGRNAVGSHRPFGPYRHNTNYKGYNHQ